MEVQFVRFGGVSSRVRARLGLGALLAAVLVGQLLHGAPASEAATGGPDQTFGRSGYATLELLNGRDRGGPLVAMPDGRLVATSIIDVDDHLAVVVRRLLPDGAPDPTFGVGGRAEISFPATIAGLDVVVLPSGAVLVGGSSYTHGTPGVAGISFFRLTKLTPAGQIDPTFAVGGALQIPADHDSHGGFTVDGLGRIVVVVDDVASLRARRFLANGLPDPLWGLLGSMTVDVPSDGFSYNPHADDVVSLPDGRTALSARPRSRYSNPSEPVLLFIGPLGNQLAAHEVLGTFDDVVDLEVDDDGRLLVLYAGAIERRSTFGVLDPAFGRRYLNMGTNHVETTGGRIVVAGYREPVEGPTRAVVAVLDDTGASLVAAPDGVVDLGVAPRAHSTAASVALRPPAGVAHPLAEVLERLDPLGVLAELGVFDLLDPLVPVDPDELLGTIVVSGTAAVADAFVASLASDGSPAPAFGRRGLRFSNLSVEGGDLAHASALDPQGRLLVLGTSSDDYIPFGRIDGAVLARLQPDGTVDPTFGEAGRVRLRGDYAGIVPQLDGGVLVVGSDRGTYTQPPQLVVTRLRPDGSLDPTFGDDGTTRSPFAVGGSPGSYVGSVTPTPLGAALVTLVIGDGPSLGDDIHLLRLLPTGVVDPTQPAGGVPLGLYRVTSITPLPGGGVGIAGRRDDTTLPDTMRGPFVLQRLLPSLTPDPLFGTLGTVVVDQGDASITPLSALIGAGTFFADGSAVVLRGTTLRRFNALGIPAGTGTLDENDLGHDVVALPDGGTIVVQEQGLTRFGPTLARDRSFGVDGTVPSPRYPQVLPRLDGTLVAVGHDGNPNHGVHEDLILVSRYRMLDPTSFPELSIGDAVHHTGPMSPGTEVTLRVPLHLTRPLHAELLVYVYTHPWTTYVRIPAGQTDVVAELDAEPMTAWGPGDTPVPVSITNAVVHDYRRSLDDPVLVTDAEGTITVRVPGVPSTTVPPMTVPPTSTPTTSTPPTTAPRNQTVTRISGEDRIATAIAVSNASRPTGVTADAVVLTRSDSYADALAGTPLAARLRAPVLMTPRAELDPRVIAEIQRVLRPGGWVAILGGPAAIDADADAQLSSLGFQVGRYAGSDRFETAALIATHGLESPASVVLATGTSFPDSLAAGAAAAHLGAALLLTDGSTLPAATSAYLQAHPPVLMAAVGGPAAAAVPAASPIVGADRFETAVRVAERFFFGDLHAIGIASGTNFPDALAGGAHIAAAGGPMLLSRPDGPPPVVQNYLATHHATHVVLYGGPSAVAGVS